MPSLAESFTLILTGLRATVAPFPYTPQPRFAYLSFIWHYVWGVSKRFARLYARWQAGTLPRPRSPRPSRAGQARKRPPIRLPRGRMWLIKDIQATAGTRSLLRHWIATTPELQQFLEAAPQARRLLNPICHMLGIDLDAPHGVPIGLPPPPPRRQRAPRQPAPAPAAPRARAPRPKKSAKTTNYSPGPCRLFSTA